MQIAWLLVATFMTELAQGNVSTRNSLNENPDKGNTDSVHYSNEWVIRLRGGPKKAQQIAEEYGYKYKGEVFGLDDTYVLIKPDHPKREKREAVHLTESLTRDKRVIWGEQQKILHRTKRDYMDNEEAVKIRRRPPLEMFEENWEALPNEEFSMDYNMLQNRNERKNNDSVFKDGFWNWVKQAYQPLKYHISNPRVWFTTPQKGGQPKRFNDELWRNQWYLHRAQHRKRANLWTSGYEILDMNVYPCWDMNITGRGVKVVILDDGLETTHTDLIENYEESISYDMNDDDPDPTPDYSGDNAHGTRCAGEVAMGANNGKCGVGVAYNCRIGGIRMLDGSITDRIEAASVGYKQNLIDVYSASWGPPDDGKTVEGPGRLTLEALENGARKGRNGKGSIFVWASGNGGSKGDSCSCDGYVNSIYTLTVSSVTQSGLFPWYGEKCAAAMTATYSSGSINEGMIVGTDINDQCTKKHSGTSAAAPIAAGIIALLLESRPDLTWRDVQHLVVQTSRYEPLKSDKSFQRNAAGLHYSPQFGFGLMDAHAMVKLSEKWQKISEQKNCQFTFHITNKKLVSRQMVNIDVPVKCPDVQYLEHVQLGVNINAIYRGALEVYLTSPKGTRQQLLYQRYRDQSNAGFQNWTFLSVATWNENPNGKWVIDVVDMCKNCEAGSVGDFNFTIYGTTEKPFYLNEGPLQPPAFPVPASNSAQKVADNAKSQARSATSESEKQSDNSLNDRGQPSQGNEKTPNGDSSVSHNVNQKQSKGTEIEDQERSSPSVSNDLDKNNVKRTFKSSSNSLNELFQRLLQMQ